MDVLPLPFGMMMVWIFLYESGKTVLTLKLDGIVRVVTALQLSKAPSAMVVTLFGMTTVVRLPQL